MHSPSKSQTKKTAARETAENKDRLGKLMETLGLNGDASVQDLEDMINAIKNTQTRYGLLLLFYQHVMLLKLLSLQEKNKFHYQRVEIYIIPTRIFAEFSLIISS